LTQSAEPPNMCKPTRQPQRTAAKSPNGMALQNANLILRHIGDSRSA
jgi:hypothetical protein